jgi:hypothetical protein
VAMARTRAACGRDVQEAVSDACMVLVHVPSSRELSKSEAAAHLAACQCMLDTLAPLVAKLFSQVPPGVPMHSVCSGSMCHSALWPCACMLPEQAHTAPWRACMLVADQAATLQVYGAPEPLEIAEATAALASHVVQRTPATLPAAVLGAGRVDGGGKEVQPKSQSRLSAPVATAASAQPQEAPSQASPIPAST